MRPSRKRKTSEWKPDTQYCVRLHGPDGSLDISVDPSQQEQVWYADILHRLHGYDASVNDVDSNRLVHFAGRHARAAASGG